MSKNGVLTNEVGSAIGDMLKANTVLKELDVSNSWWGMNDSDKDGPGFAKGLAEGISANGALVKLNMSNNHIRGAEAGKVLGDAIAANTVLQELDLSGGIAEETAIDAAFTKEFAVGLGVNGALTSLNLGDNCREAIAAAAQYKSSST